MSNKIIIIIIIIIINDQNLYVCHPRCVCN